MTPPCKCIYWYAVTLISSSFLDRDKSSENSFIIVTANTKTRGATKEIKKPTRRAGMICERAISKKNKLKKYLNWLKRTTGIKEYHVYLQLLIAFDGYDLPRFFAGSMWMSLSYYKSSVKVVEVALLTRELCKHVFFQRFLRKFTYWTLIDF